MARLTRLDPRYLLGVLTAVLVAVLILPPDALIPGAHADVTCSTVAMTCSSSGASSFTDISTGVNSTATMVCDTGCSITITGTGSLSAAAGGSVDATSMGPLSTDGTNVTLASGQLLLPDGTLAAPAIARSAAPGTGIYFAANTVNVNATSINLKGTIAVTGDNYPTAAGYDLGRVGNRWRAVQLGGSTLTASAPAVDIVQTWNSGAVTFTGLKMDVTDTASASGSLLLDLQVGSASKFSVTKAGLTTVGGLVSTTSIVAGSGNGMGWSGRGYFFATADGVFYASNAGATAFTRLGFGGVTTAFAAISTVSAVSGEAQGIIIQRGDGTAQTFANLGAATNGAMIYCSDCTIADPCAGSGTGAYAKRLNGAWVCN